jgi:uncharacterized protein with PhoU and TrkA domain
MGMDQRTRIMRGAVVLRGKSWIFSAEEGEIVRSKQLLM